MVRPGSQRAKTHHKALESRRFMVRPGSQRAKTHHKTHHKGRGYARKNIAERMRNRARIGMGNKRYTQEGPATLNTAAHSATPNQDSTLANSPRCLIESATPVRLEIV